MPVLSTSLGHTTGYIFTLDWRVILLAKPPEFENSLLTGPRFSDTFSPIKTVGSPRCVPKGGAS